MLTQIVLHLIAAYAILSLVAVLWVAAFDFPSMLDHATTYGTDRLHAAERLWLLIFVIAGLLYTAHYDKWPGVRRVAGEFWVAIVLGRQTNGREG